MAVDVIYRGGDGSARTPSRVLWANVDRDLYMNPGHGVHVYEEFENFGPTTAVASNVGRYAGYSGAYKSYEDTGDTVAALATDRQGILKVTTAATDNNESWIQGAGAVGVTAEVQKSAANGRRLLFESRVKVSQIALGNMFVGLVNTAGAAADFITDAGAMASVGFIGFSVLEAASSTLRFSYRKAGQAETVVIAALKTLVADTFYKVGFDFNPDADAAERIAIYLDGVKQATFVTKTNIEAATFPDAVGMAFQFGTKNSSAASINTSCDWYRQYQSHI